MKTYANHIRIAWLLFFLTTMVGLSAASNKDNPPYDGPESEKGILESLLGPDDRQPPQIELQDIPDNRTVYTDQVYIAGRVIDANAIEALTLNDKTVLDKSGRSVIFSHLIKLIEGENVITVKAVDEAGNIAKKKIKIIKANLSLAQFPEEIIAKRMRIAVCPFEKNGTVSGESSLFMDLLMLAFQKQNRFQLTDRALMDRILAEQKLSLTHVIDQNAAVNMGRIMSAEAIITGSIIETGSGMEMVGRLIDTETSEIMATEKIYSAGKGLAALKFLAESMSVQFHNDFPMLRGIVIKRKDKHIYTDLGGNSIPQRGRLIIYRENTVGSRSAIIGYARVTQVYPNMSGAELISGMADEIKELDRVVLQ